MPKSTVPLSMGGYTVLPLALPILPSFPQPATHYLYLRAHSSKIPDPNENRTLFVVNVPFDATEEHFRSLFTEMGGGRVESVNFEGAKVKKPLLPPVPQLPGMVGKKRKRDIWDDGLDEVEELPKTWDRELHKSGSNATVLFVDRASMESALKGAKKWAVKAQKGDVKRYLLWGDGVSEKVPPLGSARTYHLSSSML
jgi:ribosomal RNA-processing protein 7